MKEKNYVADFYNKKPHVSKSKENTFLEKIYLIFKKHELHRVDAVVELLDSGKKILDIGVGGGGLLLKASSKGFIKLYGIDVSSENIAIANKKIKGNLSIHNIDQKTKFKPGYFDSVTMVAVLEHVFDVNFVLKEINRVLKERGSVIIEVPNLGFLTRRIYQIY